MYGKLKKGDATANIAVYGYGEYRFENPFLIVAHPEATERALQYDM